jgi:Tol biopolymer transport system component
MFFSPDSKYLAYDLPASDTALERDVFVIAVDGSQDAPAVVHPAKDVVAGWSPDGSQLLFTSDRASATGLWALPVAGGKPSAAPKLLKPEIGPVSPLGVTASGALHVYKDTSTEALHVAPIDLDSGKLLGVPVAQAYRSSRPDWSRDGKYLAYKSTSDGVNFLSIRSVESGQVRELPPGLQYFSEPRWSPDAGWLVAGARDFKGRGGIYRFDAETGAVSFLAAGSHVSRVDVSPDGKKIYYNYHPDRPHSSYIEHDLASGEVRDVFQPQTETGNLELSPDGRYATTILRAETSILLLIPIAGGAPREILRLNGPERFVAFGGMTWTPDSRAVVAMKGSRDRKELWLVPVDGGPARKLDIDVSGWREDGIRLHPNGREIAFFAGGRSEEIWALENFLPGPRASR